MRATFRAMRSGEIESIRGYPVTRSAVSDQWERVDFCCAGFRGLIERVLPGTDCAPLLKVERRLAAGVLMCVEDIDAALVFLRSIEKPLMGLSVEAVTSGVRTEQLQIEMDALGVAA
jgi:hypothetical protein